MADPTVLALRHVSFEDLGVVAPVLANRGLVAHYWDAGVDPVSELEDADPALLVILGGPIGARDEALHPFLDAELALIRRRLDAGRPVLGVCLGAQLIARALGGGLRAGDAEIGWAPVDLTAAGEASVLAPLAGVPVLHWHGDRIVLPEGVESLASTATTPVQAFATASALGLQFHLEADPSRIDRWLIGHAHQIGANGLDPRVIREDAARLGPTLEPIGRRVVADWLDAVGLPG